MSQERLKQAIENNRKECSTGNVNYIFKPKKKEVKPVKKDGDK